jgi:CubicO group peptidase (beta-lactamase class C family)
MQYADVADAGFSAQALDRARRFFENRDGAAFLAVSHGAVVAAWGDVDRRFLAHSMRKSLLSALYGVLGDDIDLDLTLERLGIDDLSPLTDAEKQARVVDLLASRSGVYHPAAAEPREMSGSRPERGSHPPGTHWWYNNWDFNAAGTIFRQLTGRDIFEAFGEGIAEPLGMQDYHPIDGWYDSEPEKSLHPAYSLRISTRDLARLGLLYARGGNWRGEQIVPRRWVVDSTSAHSDIDVAEEYGTGYVAHVVGRWRAGIFGAWIRRPRDGGLSRPRSGPGRACRHVPRSFPVEPGHRSPLRARCEGGRTRSLGEPTAGAPAPGPRWRRWESRVVTGADRPVHR